MWPQNACYLCGQILLLMGLKSDVGCTMKAYKIAASILLCVAFSVACFSAYATGQSASPKYSYGLSIFGSLKYLENFKHFNYVNADAPKGGEVNEADIGSFDSLNPYIVKGNKAPGIAMVFESLMTSSLDEPQSMYGLVASGAYVAPDRSYVEFAMRSEAHFTDGTSITADDVVFSFDTLKKEGEPGYRVMMEPISSAVKLDDHHVRFNFSDKTKRELPLIAASLPILPKKYYTTHKFNETTLEPPLGSGPYKVKSVDPGRSIVYERVKDYWGKDLPVNVGQNNFDIIHIDMYHDETVALEALKAGAYDLREENISRIWATGYDCPALRSGKLKRELTPNKVPQGMQGFAFNTRRDKFADVRVREAIGLTLDFEWMNKALFYGAYKRDNSYFVNTVYAATAMPSAEEKALLEPYKDELPPELFTKEFKLPVTDGSGNDRPQIIRADKLLTDAGWVIKDGKRVNAKTGEPLTIEFMLSTPTFERVIAPMIRHLKQLGIDATLRVVDNAQYVKRLETFDFDVVVSVFNRLVFYPGGEQLAFWGSSQARQQGSNNLVGTQSKVIDFLLEKINSAKTEKELMVPARSLDRVLLWEHYVIPNWYLGAFRLAYWNKLAKPDVMPEYSYGFPQTWWIKK